MCFLCFAVSFVLSVAPGMDVLHCCWMYLRLTNIVPTARLRSLDILAFLISAVCHDLGHPGTNNTFQINSGSELAYIYNDTSCLESFHTASTFRVLAMPESNVLSTLTRGEWIEARKTIISCILATDMSHHFEMVAKLDTVFEKLERINQSNQAAAAAAAAANAAETAAASAPAATAEGTTSAVATESPAPAAAAAVNIHATSALPPRDDSARIRANTSMLPISPSSAAVSPSAASADSSNPPALELSRDEILHLLTILLHSADISNPGKPWRVARLWGDRIQAENFNQGDLERLKGLVVSPFMDRSQENQPQTSINFGDFIVAPLMAAIVRAFPPLLPLAENLIKNRKIWHQAQLDRIAHAIRAGELSGAALSAKEAERKSLTNKAQVFRNCFVLPIRKIAAQAGAGAGAAANAVAATAGAAPAATPATNAANNVAATGATAASQNGYSSAAASSNGSASSATSASSQQQQQHQSNQHHGSIAEGEEDEADATSPLATAATTSAAAQSSTVTPADIAASANAAPAAAAPAVATDAPSGVASAAAPSSQSVTTVASGAPLVRSSSASGSLDLTSTQESRVLERADALLNAVQSLVKRRHSMLENGTAPGAGGGSGSANGAAVRQGTASLGEHLGLARVSGAGASSHSQPHTPTLAALRTQQHHQHHQAADDHPPLSPPRRASLSMAQALISSSPGLGSLSVDGSLAASSDGNNGDLQSPLLSPDSRAVAEAISRSSSIVDRQVVTPLHSPHSAK